ncbi:hypothetical protein ACPEEZ_06110 [Frigoribacterium sp. 2-23]|uniref:hypothetical protein n=1 Tax=Frigoribacterium sp. 2-23 TaxID=3415006 RepID=UPI003C704928
MSDDIEMISDGEGIAIVGPPDAVDRFLAAEGLQSRDLGLGRVKPSLVASGALEAGAKIMENSGRWVKLTKESAAAMNKYGVMKGTGKGLSRGVLTENGKIKGLIQFSRGGVGTLTNPAMLAGAAGLMSQIAMQQQMDEISDYLAEIDAKVDDVLRAQKDAVLADMVGVDLVIDGAMTIRGEVGRVSEITWSKVHTTSTTVARTQVYALRQLDALADKLEKKKISELEEATREVESKAQEWFAVLARCFQLQDALSVLELDRVLDASPDDLDRHRVGLAAARSKRLEVITQRTELLVDRLEAAAGLATSKVLLHPIASAAIVRSSNNAGSAITRFQDGLGIENSHDMQEAKRWATAVVEMRDKAIDRGEDGVDAARRLGDETLDRAKSVSVAVTSKLAERARRWQKSD